MQKESHNSKTIVFFPFQIGLAHITRSLAVAEELFRMGHTIKFVVSKQKHHIIRKTPVPLIHLTSISNKDHIQNTNFFRDIKLLKKVVSIEYAYLKKIKPDLVVVDYHLSALASSAALSIPTVLITHGSGLPCYFRIPDLGFPFYLDILVKPFISWWIMIAKRLYLQGLHHVSKDLGNSLSLNEWFKTAYYLLPEPKGYFISNNNNLKIFHTGPLYWKGFDKKLPKSIDIIRPDGKTIYVTFGGTGFDKVKLIKLAKELIQNGYRVIVTCGTIADKKDFMTHKRLFINDFLPGEEVMKRVDLVICHGGYGTLIQAIRQNKPFIALAFNPDQIVHSYRMKEMGLGVCMNTFTMKRLVSFITFGLTFQWKKVEEINKRISVKDIVDETNVVLKIKKKYIQNIKNYNMKNNLSFGAKKAALLLEKIALKN